MKRMEMYLKICSRAEKMNLLQGMKFNAIMDIESADLKFNLDLDGWLDADDFNFAHDFIGIRSNIDRSVYPATNFGYFLPRFARKGN